MKGGHLVARRCVALVDGRGEDSPALRKFPPIQKQRDKG